MNSQNLPARTPTDEIGRPKTQAGYVLIVDDDKFSRELYRDLLREAGHRVCLAATAKEAFSLLEHDPFDVVITDIIMPELDGFGVLHHVGENYPKVDVIVTTGYADVEGAVKALKLGAKDYLRKPVNPEEFKLVVHRCLEQRNLFAQNQEFRRYLNLFEACHRISGCLEMERLLPLSLHALGQELDAQDGLAVSLDPEFRSFKVNFLSLGSKLELESLNKAYQKLLDGKNIFDCSNLTLLENPPSPKNTQRALILPLQIEEDVKVVFLLFYEKDTLSQSLSQETLEQRTLFIGRQIELSMKNALELSRARQQAFLDDLTGLYNARYLSVILKRELKRSQRFNHSLSVLFIDLDYFKLVNDEHGHLVGSRLLVEIAQVIKGCLREIDSAIRYGGDEYTIILVNTDSKGAHKVGERIRKAIEKYELILNDGTKVKTAACIGTASYPEHAQGVQDLLDMADQAMYRGKKTTRNVVYTFNSSISNSEKRS